MRKMRAAIIGLGRIGFELDARTGAKYVISYARALSLHNGFELACGFDIDRRKLDAFSKKYRVSAYHYRELEEYLADIDVVVIAVPIEGHFKVFKRVISSSGPRMIIMEKPIASNPGQAKEILAEARKNKLLLYVNYFRRVDPGINNLKQRILSKKWGRLRHVNIYYGNGLLNNGSHFIDLMVYLLGRPDSIRLLRHNGGDNPDFIFYYKQFSVYFKSSLGIDYHLKEMDFIFEKARVAYSRFSLTRLMLPVTTLSFGVKELSEVDSKNLHLDMDKYMSTVISHVYNVLRGKKEILSTGQTALETLEICLDIMKRADRPKSR